MTLLPLVLFLTLLLLVACGWIQESVKYQAQLRDELKSREETIKTLKWERDQLYKRIAKGHT